MALSVLVAVIPAKVWQIYWTRQGSNAGPADALRSPLPKTVSTAFCKLQALRLPPFSPVTT